MEALECIKTRRSVRKFTEEEVAAIIAIGHPAEQPQAPARKDVDTLLRVIE